MRQARPADSPLASPLRLQESALELTRRALAGEGLASLAEDATRLLVVGLAVDHAEVLELRSDGASFGFLASSDPEAGRQADPAGAPDPTLARALRDGLVALPDAPLDVPARLRERGLSAGLIAAIVGRGRPVGVVGAYAREARPFGEAEGLFVRSVAQALGAAAITRDVAERARAHEALGRSEAALRSAQRVAGVGSWEWDLRTNEVRWSDETHRLHGLPRERFDGTLASIIASGIIHPDDVDAIRETLRRIAKEGVAAALEYRVVRPDGDVRILVGRAELSPDPSGRPRAILGTIQDVTDARAVEEALRRTVAELREREERLRLALDGAGLGTWAWDVDDRILVWDERTKEVFGVDPEAGGLRFDDFLDLVHEEDRDAVRSAVARSVSDGLPYQREYRIVRPDGTIRTVAVLGRARRSADGAPTRMLGVIRDVTETNRAERLLHTLAEQTSSATGAAYFERLVRAAAEASHADVSFVARYLAGEPKRLRTVAVWSDGAPGEPFMYDLVGTPCEDVIEHGRVCAFARGVQAAFPEDETLAELDIQAYVGAPLQDRDGRSLGIFVLLFRRPLEAPAVLVAAMEVFAARAAAEMERLDRERERIELEEQLRQAQKMEAVGQLAGGVAHDFNNLLTVIAGYAELAATPLPHGASPRRELEEIKRAADRATAMVRQLLAFSRKQVLRLEPIDLSGTVRGLESMLSRLIGEHIVIEAKLSRALPPVVADRGQIEQVIVNLALNARDAMPDGGTLWIETTYATVDEAYARAHVDCEPGAYGCLVVRDDGVGMDEATRARIFEPFFTTKRVGEGTGLGLATVYGIVRQCGGFVRVESAPREGSRFEVHLPLASPASGAPGDRASAAGVAAPGARARGTILVVEDETVVLSFIRVVLEREGFRVLTASRGDEALGVADREQGAIDLLVTDVVMPGMSGKALADRLTASRPELRVLFVSGYTGGLIARQGVLDGGVDLLAKPFSPDQLAARVREALAR